MLNSSTDKPGGVHRRRLPVRFLTISVGCLAVVFVLAAVWNWHEQNRTTRIRAVRQRLIYMQDGTVWRVYGRIYALKGDAVRFESQGGGDECILVDTTTGWSRSGLRVSSPFGHTSCPATSKVSRIMGRASLIFRHDRQPKGDVIVASPDEISPLPVASPRNGHGRQPRGNVIVASPDEVSPLPAASPGNGHAADTMEPRQAEAGTSRLTSPVNLLLLCMLALILWAARKQLHKILFGNKGTKTAVLGKSSGYRYGRTTIYGLLGWGLIVLLLPPNGHGTLRDALLPWISLESLSSGGWLRASLAVLDRGLSPLGMLLFVCCWGSALLLFGRAGTNSRGPR